MVARYINDIFYKDVTFYPGFETFCYQNCQKILLEAQGLGFPELYINATLSLGYDSSNNDIFTLDGARTLLPDCKDKAERFYYRDSDMATEDIFKKNLEYMVESDKAIIVGIDSYYLHYASNYMKNHARHTLVLCGYDMNEEAVYVIDWYPEWFYKGKVSIEAFLKGRESENPWDGTMFSGKSIMNNWAYIADIEPKSPRVLLRELLDTVFREYYRETEVEGVVYGITALEKMRREFMNIELPEQFNKIYRKMMVVSKRNKLFVQYLECYKKVLTDEDTEFLLILNEIIDVSIRLINEWDVLLMLILKAGKVLNDKVRQRLSDKFELVISEEKDRKEKLLQLYKVMER